MNWKTLSPIAIKKLTETRLQLHHLVQLPAIFARSFLQDDKEDKNANLGWDPKIQGLMSRGISVQKGQLTIGISLESSTLVAQGPSGENSLAMHGNTWEEAYSWMEKLAGSYGLEINKIDKQQPYDKDLPEFPTQSGSKFNFSDQQELTFLAHAFANTQEVLDEVQRKYPTASAIRCWPHHFDMATLIEFEGGKSIGMGMSPGDGMEEAPYFYLNMWPYPDTEKINLPELPYGRWNTKGWVGTVLSSKEIVSEKNQGIIVRSFFKESTHHAQTLLHIGS